MSEEWREIPGWEDFYQVSDLGRVKSLARVTPGRWSTPMHFRERIRKAHPVKGGYLRISLTAGERQEKRLVHRLVLSAFLGQCPEGFEALHLDSNPTNNRRSNLRWGTPSENVLAQVAAGTHNQASKTHCPHGHPYSEENTYLLPRGGRACRTCRAATKSRRAA